VPFASLVYPVVAVYFVGEKGYPMSGSRALLIILITVAVLVVLRFVFKLISGGIQLKTTFADAGRRSISRLQDTIDLESDNAYQFRDPNMEAHYFAPLKALGLEDAGTYVARNMAGVHIRFFVSRADNVYVNVYEHPQAGNWVEMVTKYSDHSWVSASTLPPTGVSNPPWIIKLHGGDKNAPIAELYQRLLKERKPGEMREVNTANVKDIFEEGYAQFMAWKKNAGISPAEVARVWALRKKKLVSR
jgi:hypothetical protein